MIHIKKGILIQFLFLFLINGCGPHDPATLYVFRIDNKTKTTLYVESELNNCNIGLKIDTICQGPKFIISNLGFCYKDYHDTLIQSMFSILTIKTDKRKVKIDPFIRANWKDSFALKRVTLFCKGGKVYYTLVINESDL